jgi:hypothetical protein
VFAYSPAHEVPVTVTTPACKVQVIADELQGNKELTSAVFIARVVHTEATHKTYTIVASSSAGTVVVLGIRALHGSNELVAGGVDRKTLFIRQQRRVWQHYRHQWNNH